MGEGKIARVGANKNTAVFALEAMQSLISNYVQYKFMKQFPNTPKIGSAKYFMGAVDFLLGSVNNSSTEYGRNEIYYRNKDWFYNNEDLFPNYNVDTETNDNNGW